MLEKKKFNYLVIFLFFSFFFLSIKTSNREEIESPERHDKEFKICDSFSRCELLMGEWIQKILFTKCSSQYQNGELATLDPQDIFKIACGDRKSRGCPISLRLITAYRKKDIAPDKLHNYLIAYTKKISELKGKIIKKHENKLKNNEVYIAILAIVKRIEKNLINNKIVKSKIIECISEEFLKNNFDFDADEKEIIYEFCLFYFVENNPQLKQIGEAEEIEEIQEIDSDEEQGGGIGLPVVPRSVILHPSQRYSNIHFLAEEHPILNQEGYFKERSGEEKIDISGISNSHPSRASILSTDKKDIDFDFEFDLKNYYVAYLKKYIRQNRLSTAFLGISTGSFFVSRVFRHPQKRNFFKKLGWLGLAGFVVEKGYRYYKKKTEPEEYNFELVFP